MTHSPKETRLVYFAHVPEARRNTTDTHAEKPASKSVIETAEQKAKREAAEAERKKKEAGEKEGDAKAAEALIGQIETQDVPAEYNKKSSREIRALSTKKEHAEKLAKACFLREKEGKWEPATPGTLQVNDKLKFHAGNDALDKGVGCKVLRVPENLKFVSNNGSEIVFINHTPLDPKTGDYRAVLTAENEVFQVAETTEADKKQIAELKKSDNYKGVCRFEAGSYLDSWLNGRELTPELVDQFSEAIQADPEVSPEIKQAAKDHAESLKKFAEIWKGFNIANYKDQIAAIESAGANYKADNHGKNARDPWGLRAIGRYQFTIDTLNGMGITIRNEADIANFKSNPNLQEEVMDRFTAEHIDRIRASSRAVAKISEGKYSIYQVLAAMHLGGPGGLVNVERGTLSGRDYMGTSFDEYMHKMKGPTKMTA